MADAFNIRADLDVQRKNAETSVQETQEDIDRINQELVNVSNYFFSLLQNYFITLVVVYRTG